VPDYTDLLGFVDPAMLSQLHVLSLNQAGDMPVARASSSAVSTARLLMSQTTTGVTSMLSDWGSPDSRLDRGVQGDKLHKFCKSASFAFHGQSPAPVLMPAEPNPVERGEMRQRVWMEKRIRSKGLFFIYV
jgi:hypothetical protein